MASPRPWNVNIHYHPLVLDVLPERTSRVLDVGCGDGILSAQIALARKAHVVGLDIDEGVLARAKARHPEAAVEWMLGDALSVPFEASSFDAVVSVAALHHMDAQAALARFKELAAPGGVVAIIGLAAAAWWDVPHEGVAVGARAAFSFVRGHWEHSAPMAWPPPVTYLDMKRISALALPGVRFRRHLLGRYSLVWHKPS